MRWYFRFTFRKKLQWKHHFYSSYDLFISRNWIYSSVKSLPRNWLLPHIRVSSFQHSSHNRRVLPLTSNNDSECSSTNGNKLKVTTSAAMLLGMTKHFYRHKTSLIGPQLFHDCVLSKWNEKNENENVSSKSVVETQLMSTQKTWALVHAYCCSVLQKENTHHLLLWYWGISLICNSSS